MQVTTEGGFDAAMEAPYIYAAIDALALRAGKWAERRQRLILEGVSADAALITPEAASAAAVAAVKEVCFLSPSQEPQDLQDRSGPLYELSDRSTPVLLEGENSNGAVQSHAPSQQGTPIQVSRGSMKPLPRSWSCFADDERSLGFSQARHRQEGC